MRGPHRPHTSLFHTSASTRSHAPSRLRSRPNIPCAPDLVRGPGPFARPASKCAKQRLLGGASLAAWPLGLPIAVQSRVSASNRSRADGPRATCNRAWPNQVAGDVQQVQTRDRHGCLPRQGMLLRRSKIAAHAVRLPTRCASSHRACPIRTSFVRLDRCASGLDRAPAARGQAMRHPVQNDKKAHTPHLALDATGEAKAPERWTKLRCARQASKARMEHAS